MNNPIANTIEESKISFFSYKNARRNQNIAFSHNKQQQNNNQFWSYKSHLSWFQTRPHHQRNVKIFGWWLWSWRWQRTWTKFILEGSSDWNVSDYTRRHLSFGKLYTLIHIWTHPKFDQIHRFVSRTDINCICDIIPISFEMRLPFPSLTHSRSCRWRQK